MKKPKPPPKDQVLTMRVTSAERAYLKERAEAKEMTVSDLLRMAVAEHGRLNVAITVNGVKVQ